MKKAALVVLHYQDKKLTRGCLRCIRQLDCKNLSLLVIIVNNNPEEDLTKLKSEFNEFIFIEAGRNLGFAEGNNVGIRKALDNGADYLFLINNDTVFKKDLLAGLIKVMDSDKSIGILGPKIYFAPGYEFRKNRYRPEEKGRVFWYAGGVIDWQNVISSHRGVDEVDQGQYDQQQETDFVSGCAMLVRREVFEKIGLFDRRYFLYLEDNDLCQRAKKAGFKIIYGPVAHLWHLNAGSSAVGGSLQDYFLTRNRLLFGMKNAPLRSKLALLRESLKLLRQGRRWQKTGVRDFYLARFEIGSWQKDLKE